MAKQNGIGVLVVAVKQDEDDEFDSGTVFYNSGISGLENAFGEFDALRDVITEAHKVGIRVHAWVPQFHDQIAFQRGGTSATNGVTHYNWAMKAKVNGEVVDYTGSRRTDTDGNRVQVTDYFVNPLHPDVQDYERSIIREICAGYDIDGIVLDWIRFDDWNMDLSPISRNAFYAQYGFDPIGIDFTKDSDRRRQWQEFRTTKLADYLNAVRIDVKAIKPDLALGVYILPPEFEECGQDTAKLADSIDFISPMCYFDDWGYPIEWVYNNVIRDTRAGTGANMAIIPALDSDYTASQYKLINSGIRTHFPDSAAIAYFAYGRWTSSMISRVNKARNY